MLSGTWGVRPIKIRHPGDKKEHYEIVDFPFKCEECPMDNDNRKNLGCGVSSGIPWTPSADGNGYSGQAVMPYLMGSKIEPYNKTCPNYYRRSPFFNSITELADDYKNNRLGQVQLLPAPLLTYLRVYTLEASTWMDYWKAEEMGN